MHEARASAVCSHHRCLYPSRFLSWMFCRSSCCRRCSVSPARKKKKSLRLEPTKNDGVRRSEYKEDNAIVTKNTSVVVRRAPAPKSGGLLSKIRALDAAAALQSTAKYGQVVGEKRSMSMSVLSHPRPPPRRCGGGGSIKCDNWSVSALAFSRYGSSFFERWPVGVVAAAAATVLLLLVSCCVASSSGLVAFCGSQIGGVFVGGTRTRVV